MDGRRFDDLAKRLAAGATRRGLVRALGGGLLGGALARAGWASAAACQPPGGLCLPHARCCAGDCDRRTHRCPPPCGPGTCAGCCDASGACRTDAAATACGIDGAACQDCTAGGTQSGGVCDPFTGACCQTADTCCADVATCQARCCTGRATLGGDCGAYCAYSHCGFRCASADDCTCPGPNGPCACVGGTCTCASGTCDRGACRA